MRGSSTIEQRAGRACCTPVTVAFTLFTIGWTCFGQTRIDLQTQSKRVDFSAADLTKPMKTGGVLPVTCTAGEVFLLLTAPAGSNVYTCLATNIWTVQNGSIPAPDSAGKVLAAKQDGSFQWIVVPTTGDLSAINTAVAGKAPLSHGHAGSDITSGTVPAARIQKVIGLADLSDVSAKQGAGTAVVMSDTPTITTPIVPGYYTLGQIAAPAAPSSGFLRVYGKTGVGLCWKDSTNTETCAGAVGQSGGSTTTVQSNGAAVGSPRSTIDMIDGAGITSTVTDTGSKITIQTAIGPAVQTKANDQTSAHLLCSAGASNALTCSMSPTLTTYTDKMLVNLCTTGAVSGATSLNIDTLGAKAVLTAAGANPAPADLGAGCRLVTYYSASNAFRLPATGSGTSLSTNSSVLMRSGGCNDSGFGMYTDWGVVGVSLNCSGAGNTQAMFGFGASGTPTAHYYFRIPQDWSSSGTTSFVIREVNKNGGAGDVRYNVSIACPAVGEAYNAHTWNTATAVTFTLGLSGAYADRLFTPLATGSCAAGDFAVLRVVRDTTVANNAATEDYWAGGELRYVRQ